LEPCVTSSSSRLRPLSKNIHDKLGTRPQWLFLLVILPKRRGLRSSSSSDCNHYVPLFSSFRAGLEVLSCEALLCWKRDWHSRLGTRSQGSGVEALVQRFTADAKLSRQGRLFLTSIYTFPKIRRLFCRQRGLATTVLAFFLRKGDPLALGAHESGCVQTLPRVVVQPARVVGGDYV